MCHLISQYFIKRYECIQIICLNAVLLFVFPPVQSQHLVHTPFMNYKNLPHQYCEYCSLELFKLERNTGSNTTHSNTLSLLKTQVPIQKNHFRRYLKHLGKKNKKIITSRNSSTQSYLQNTAIILLSKLLVLTPLSSSHSPLIQRLSVTFTVIFIQGLT